MREKADSPLRIVVLIAGLAGLTTILFARALRLPLLADDYTFISHGQVPGWWHSRTTWNLGGIIFRPVPLIWIGAFNHTFGLHPLPYHLASEALLIGAGVVVAMIARRLGLGLGAYAAAAVFCLHASMATPVGWAAAVNSPLGTLLSLSAVYILLRHRVRTSGVVVACVLFTIALMTREVVAVTPAILFMTRYLVETDDSRQARIRRSAVVTSPLLVVLVVYAVIRRIAGFSPRTGAYAQRLSFHGLTNLRRLMEFATNVDRFGAPHDYAIFVATFWLALIVLCVLAACRGRRPQGLVGLLWALVGVLPVIFLAVHPMEFYYVDFALPGLAIAVGTLFDWAVDSLPDRAAIPFAALCLALFFALSAGTARKEMNAQLEAEVRQSEKIIAQVKRDYPNPPKGSTIVVRDSPGHYLTQGGTTFRVLYHDPTLKVQFVPG